ncbi:helix-turn-helix domain-containing protein [Actinokineospora spheciospongiae]|uniref:helix-turn-helix domain-containing protein n=1 Tax=Actinokineospora spheciospongiae TaxID=909613 RepID=UPI000D70C24F|nr:Scr1 family TA system antitoxin-like transcriptional regulator [Actinokineospora spheciospongiae]PWW65657.1 helix-turn-helix protein [Actinokineospora spheciospongiae]
MSAPTTTPPGTDDSGVRAKTLRGLLLARELDSARLARGFTTRELASAMSMSPAMVNRVMTGRRVPTALEIGGLCAVLDVPAARRPLLYRRAAATDLTGWVVHAGTGDDPIGDVEAVADGITGFDPALVPRPLRTPAYERAIGSDRGRADPALLRISRFFLHPSALSHPAVSAETMRDQLLHLVENHAHRVRLLPIGVAREPGFRVLEVGHFPSVVHIEHHGTDVLLEEPAATGAHTAFLRHLTDVALSGSHTGAALRNLIR